jgi:hypothetical protein
MGGLVNIWDANNFQIPFLCLQSVPMCKKRQAFFPSFFVKRYAPHMAARTVAYYPKTIYHKQQGINLCF